MRAFGASPAVIEAKTKELAAGVNEETAFQVCPENETAVRLFAFLITQWVHVAMSTMTSARLIPIGLDYGRIEPTARLAGLELTPGDTLIRLQVMEAEAIAAWKEAAA